MVPAPSPVLRREGLLTNEIDNDDGEAVKGHGQCFTYRHHSSTLLISYGIWAQNTSVRG